VRVYLAVRCWSRVGQFFDRVGGLTGKGVGYVRCTGTGAPMDRRDLSPPYLR
jgi:hypothetical protein